MPDVKSFRIAELKMDGEGEGTFEAAFVNLNAIDHDGDGYDTGAIGEQKVMISQWNHGSWGDGVDALPIGVGKTFERDGWGVVSGAFDMDDEDAVKTYRKVKYLYDRGFPVEWSFALPKADWRMEERDGRQVRVFTDIEIPEVSPVLMGAGIDTHLTAIKGREPMPPENDASMTFAKQLDEAVEAVESVVERAKQIKALREEKGRDNMSKRSTRRLKALLDALREATVEVEDILTDPNDELRAIAAQFEEGENASEATG
jgi:hypothetical protein